MRQLDSYDKFAASPTVMVEMAAYVSVLVNLDPSAEPSARARLEGVLRNHHYSEMGIASALAFAQSL